MWAKGKFSTGKPRCSDQWLVADSRITYVFMPLELITSRYSYGCALPLNFNKP